MMVSESILCAECGITLRPFMRECPRCGAVREEAKPMQEPASESAPRPAAPKPDPLNSKNPADAKIPVAPPIPSAPRGADGRQDNDPKFEVISLDAAQRRGPATGLPFIPEQHAVFRSPEETRRRFPLFTSAQWTLMAIGVGLLILMMVVAYLLWRQQQRDMGIAVTRNAVAATLPTPSPSPTVEPSPTPTPSDDQLISEQVKAQLMAYNPVGFSRYNFEVKDGIVTINGEAEHQPEKDGIDNILKLIAGVKSVVNNLKVKTEQPSAPVKLNLAEAKILDDALRRDIESAEQAANVDPPQQTRQLKPPSQSDAQREARDKAAAKLREEDTAMRRAAEDKLRREAEDYEKRQEELRQAESERRARAEQARIETSALRSGTIAWSGTIDGVDEVIISGTSASVRHMNGNPPREVKASFSAPFPRSPVNVALLSTNGRGVITIIQQPSAANGYTTIVRLDDSAKGGDKRYEFTLRWSAQ
jgi:hypothetical protein